MSKDQGKFVKSWNWFRAECLVVARLTFAHMRKAVELARDTLDERRFRKQSDAKREVLGQCLFDASLGSKDLRQQFTDLQERITSVEAASGSTRLLKTERRGLLLRLADDYLNQISMAGTPGEPTAVYDARKNVDGAVNAHDMRRSKLSQTRAELSIVDPEEKKRVLIGYGVTAFLVVLILWMLTSTGAGEAVPRPDDQQIQADELPDETLRPL